MAVKFEKMVESLILAPLVVPPVVDAANAILIDLKNQVSATHPGVAVCICCIMFLFTYAKERS